MKIKIIRNINNGRYAHYPSQVLIDHPDEKKLVDEGYARAIPEEPETAILPKAETRIIRPAEQAKAATRKGK